MGLNFNRPDAPTQTAPAAQAELEQVKSYDIVVDRKQMSAELVGSKEVDDIVSTIEVNNLETIVSFGAEGRRRDLQSIGCGVKQHGYETAG